MITMHIKSQCPVSTHNLRDVGVAGSNPVTPTTDLIRFFPADISCWVRVSTAAGCELGMVRQYVSAYRFSNYHLHLFGKLNAVLGPESELTRGQLRFHQFYVAAIIFGHQGAAVCGSIKKAFISSEPGQFEQDCRPDTASFSKHIHQ